MYIQKYNWQHSWKQKVLIFYLKKNWKKAQNNLEDENDAKVKSCDSVDNSSEIQEWLH